MRVACGVLVRPPRAQLGWSTAEAGVPFKTAPSWIVGDDEDTDSGAVLRREGELLPLTVRPSLLEYLSPSPRGAPQLTMQESFQLITRRYLKRPERCGARTSQFACRLFEALHGGPPQRIISRSSSAANLVAGASQLALPLVCGRIRS